MGNKNQIIASCPGLCCEKSIHLNNNDNNIQSNNKPPYTQVNKNSFEYIEIIGRGGFSKVWKVYDKRDKKVYALKQLSKVKIIDTHSESSVIAERDMLSKIYHPFIVNMHYSFQDSDHLYLVMDILTGGDLRYHFSKNKIFTEEQTKFLICCIILSLEYIHSNCIIHRDLKPENLVLDAKGYLRLTDFGIAKIYHSDKQILDNSGTPGYMAPEVMCNQPNTYVVDYFALGVIVYEFMRGYRPYLGKNRKEIKDKILSKQVQIDRYQLPIGWSLHAGDFVNSLLQRKPNKRLGNKGVEEVKQHPWIKYFNWKDLYLEKLEPPFVPNNQDNYDREYCNHLERIGLHTKERYERIDRNVKYKEVFKEYVYYDRKHEIEKEDATAFGVAYASTSNSNCMSGGNTNHVTLIGNGGEMLSSITKDGTVNVKSRNKNVINVKDPLTMYTNPHLIYKILDEKELKAFAIDKLKNENKNSHRHGRNKSRFSISSNLFHTAGKVINNGKKSKVLKDTDNTTSSDKENNKALNVNEIPVVSSSKFRIKVARNFIINNNH